MQLLLYAMTTVAYTIPYCTRIERYRTEVAVAQHMNGDYYDDEGNGDEVSAQMTVMMTAAMTMAMMTMMVIMMADGGDVYDDEGTGDEISTLFSIISILVQL